MIDDIDNSTYGAIAQSVKYITDRHPGVSMRVINLELPITHQSILDATAAALRELNKPSVPNYTGRPRATGVDVGQRVRCLVLDHVASVPGYVSSPCHCGPESGGARVGCVGEDEVGAA